MSERLKLARLVVLTGGRRLELALVDRVTIGRSHDCDLVLDDSFASRLHAEITREPDGFAIYDRGSTNGTRVIGEALLAGQGRLLRHGDEIQLGESMIRYLEDGQPDPRTRPQRRSTANQLQCRVQVDVDAWRVWVDGEEVQLAPQEFRFLALLFQKAGDVCAREEICRELWSDEKAFDPLHELVHRVKQRIEPEPKSPRYLITVAGVGYRLATQKEGPD